MLYAKLIRRLSLVALVTSLLILPAHAHGQVYELRTYTTNEGKLDNLNARFRDHTVGLFKKHGMESVGYWVPTDEPKSKNTLIYVIKHESRDAAKASWKAFIADPEWQKAAKESELDGRILAKAPESIYMEATEFSPKYSNDEKSDDAVFELRIYHSNEGKFENLEARVRDHEVPISIRHGIQSVAYWHPVDEPDSQNTLIYILRHESRKAANASWEAFDDDEEWKKVAVESQREGRILKESPVVIFMKATDYSAIR